MNVRVTWPTSNLESVQKFFLYSHYSLKNTMELGFKPCFNPTQLFPYLLAFSFSFRLKNKPTNSKSHTKFEIECYFLHVYMSELLKVCLEIRARKRFAKEKQLLSVLSCLGLSQAEEAKTQRKTRGMLFSFSLLSLFLSLC